MSKSSATIRKESLVSAEHARSILDYDPGTGIFTWKKRAGKTPDDNRWNTRNACNEAGATHCGGYREICINGNRFLSHRLAWLIDTGEWPKDQIDHIDGDRSNNRRLNLRQATDSDNRKNQKIRSNNSSTVMGVSWRPKYGAWRARINVNKKDVHLGSFREFSDAVEARKLAEIMYGFHPNHGRKS
jgi:hypothetical protein